MSILLVEDNEMTAMVFEANLAVLKRPVTIARDGEEALRYLDADPSIEIVISDVSMPGMNGLELLRHMRDSALFNDIPVILCTGARAGSTVTDAAAMGCASYLAKPVHPELLLKRVRDALKDQKPALRPRAHVKSQFNLSDTTYAKLLSTFVRLLAEQVSLLERDGEISMANVRSIAESSSIIGAERLDQAVNDLIKDNDTQTIPMSKCSRLAREIKLTLREASKRGGPDENNHAA